VQSSGEVEYGCGGGTREQSGAFSALGLTRARKGAHHGLARVVVVGGGKAKAGGLSVQI